MEITISPGQMVSAAVLDEAPDSFSVRIINLVNREMIVACEKVLRLGAPIRVDLPGRMLLGDVVWIQPQDGAFVVAIRHCIQWQAIEQIRRNWT